ncbi:elaB [Candidatus Sodalis pierantonius str. SOPE]|uniref:ElaB n=1 Tax=Candidatus Sodalis pierantonii str. SOPE TaxID=2342 RepID=W0HQH9_9GAMM|nr:stress response protein ElaB [Candidatus Sodalis pierantonius]AHF74393.1 elaB [Candidatus Sodalis pierantonius str. SOPE]
MTTPNDPLQPHETHVDDDVQLLSETLEEVLAYSGDKTDQKYVELKTRAQQALDDVKTRVSHASDTYYLKARQAVSAADDYVQENPWHGVGIGASVGLVVGLLLARR